MRPLHERYDGLKTGEITLFLSRYTLMQRSHYKTSGLAPEFLALYYKKC